MATLKEYCAQLDKKLADLPDLPERISVSASALAQAFRVAPDEVALFRLKEGTVLNFLWPEKLRKVGFIPLNSHDSLAARTIRENRPFLHNDFASARHTGVFEIVHLDKERGRPLPILKILSAPLVCSGEPIGAIQISRKGEKESLDLPDFTPQDLEQLGVLCAVVARHL